MDRILEQVQNGDFDPVQLFTGNKDKFLEVKTAIESISNNLSKEVCINCVTSKIVPTVFDKNVDSSVRDQTVDLGLYFLKYVNISMLDTKEQENVFNSMGQTYTKFIGDLRDSNYPNWDKLWIFLIKLCGEKLHTKMSLANKLLRIVEVAFRNSTSIDQRLKAYDCWVELINNSSLNMNYMCSPKQIKLLITPLKAKFSRIPVVIIKRCDTFVYLLEKLQDKATLCLKEFLEFCFGPFDERNDAEKMRQGRSVSEVCNRSTKLLLEILSHSHNNKDVCLKNNDLELYKPLITDLNFSSFADILINSVIECCILLKEWSEDMSRNITIIKCLWRSLLKLIQKSNQETKIQCYTHINNSFKKLLESSHSIEHTHIVLGSVFELLIEEEMIDTMKDTLFQIGIKLLSQISVNPCFINVENVSNFLVSCFDTEKESKYEKMTSDFFKNDVENNTSTLCSVWLKCKLTLVPDSVLNMTWPIRHLQNFKDIEELNLKWTKAYNENKLETVKVVLMQEIEKMFLQNPLLASHVVHFLQIISSAENNPTKDFVAKFMRLIELVLTLPNLPDSEIKKLKAIIITYCNANQQFYKTENNDEAINKVCGCLEHLLTIHKDYTVLTELTTHLKNFHGKNLLKFSEHLMSCLDTLMLNEDMIIVNNTRKLIEVLEKKETEPEKSISLTNSRSLRIVNMANVTPKVRRSVGHINSLNIFKRQLDVQSPISVKNKPVSNAKDKIKKQKESIPSLNDDQSSDYVKIETEVKIDVNNMSEHQKEVLKKRREDIPALYQDLTQSQSQDFFEKISQTKESKSKSELPKKDERKSSSPSKKRKRSENDDSEYQKKSKKRCENIISIETIKKDFNLNKGRKSAEKIKIHTITPEESDNLQNKLMKNVKDVHLESSSAIEKAGEEVTLKDNQEPQNTGEEIDTSAKSKRRISRNVVLNDEEQIDAEQNSKENIETAVNKKETKTENVKENEPNIESFTEAKEETLDNVENNEEVKNKNFILNSVVEKEHKSQCNDKNQLSKDFVEENKEPDEAVDTTQIPIESDSINESVVTDNSLTTENEYNESTDYTLDDNNSQMSEIEKFSPKSDIKQSTPGKKKQGPKIIREIVALNILDKGDNEVSNENDNIAENETSVRKSKRQVKKLNYFVRRQNNKRRTTNTRQKEENRDSSLNTQDIGNEERTTNETDGEIIHESKKKSGFQDRKKVEANESFEQLLARVDKRIEDNKKKRKQKEAEANKHSSKSWVELGLQDGNQNKIVPPKEKINNNQKKSRSARHAVKGRKHLELSTNPLPVTTTSESPSLESIDVFEFQGNEDDQDETVKRKRLKKKRTVFHRSDYSKHRRKRRKSDKDEGFPFHVTADSHLPLSKSQSLRAVPSEESETITIVITRSPDFKNKENTNNSDTSFSFTNDDSNTTLKKKSKRRSSELRNSEDVIESSQAPPLSDTTRRRSLKNKSLKQTTIQEIINPLIQSTPKTESVTLECKSEEIIEPSKNTIAICPKGNANSPEKEKNDLPDTLTLNSLGEVTSEKELSLTCVPVLLRKPNRRLSLIESSVQNTELGKRGKRSASLDKLDSITEINFLENPATVKSENIEHVNDSSADTLTCKTELTDTQETAITDTEQLQQADTLTLSPAKTKEDLPGSPINYDTPDRQIELLNNTFDISPISSSQEDETQVLTPKQATKEVSNVRVARLLRMVNPNVPVGEGRRWYGNKHSSPSTSRVRKMRLKKEENLDLLTFSREIPSPLTVPSSGILKRKLQSLEDTPAPSPKRKRVNFSDPAITEKKLFIKDAEEYLTTDQTNENTNDDVEDGKDKKSKEFSGTLIAGLSTNIKDFSDFDSNQAKEIFKHVIQNMKISEIVGLITEHLSTADDSTIDEIAKTLIDNGTSDQILDKYIVPIMKNCNNFDKIMPKLIESVKSTSTENVRRVNEIIDASEGSEVNKVHSTKEVTQEQIEEHVLNLGCDKMNELIKTYYMNLQDQKRNDFLVDLMNLSSSELPVNKEFINCHVNILQNFVKKMTD